MGAHARYGFAWTLAATVSCGGVTLSLLPNDDADDGVIAARDGGAADRSAPSTIDGGQSDPGVVLPTIDPIDDASVIVDAGNFTDFGDCPIPGDFNACGSDEDCDFSKVGCYCGAQPMLGVSTSVKLLVDLCEQAHANSCAQECLQTPGFVTQSSSQIVQDATGVGVRCAGSLCITYVK
jgi:hypothetical protein